MATANGVVPASDLPSGIVPASDLPSNSVPASDLPTHKANEVPTSDLHIVATPHEYDSDIAAAAAKHDVPTTLLRQVGMQETGLGSSAVYDSATGMSRTSGNGGHGLWQLDPASGASPQVLARAAHDPAFAADYAAGMLAAALKETHGNVRAALARYNAGSPTSPKGLAYADAVLGRTLDPLDAASPIIAHATASAHLDAPGHVEQAGLGPAVTGIVHGVDQGFRKIVDLSNLGGQDALSGLNALLGAPQRYVQGALTAGASEPKGKQANVIETARRGLYDVFHPNDQNQQNKELDSILSVVHLPKEEGTDLKSRILRAAEAFGTQTGTDPLTYLPILGEIKAGARAVDIIDRMSAAAHDAPQLQRFLSVAHKASQHSVVQSLRSTADTLHGVAQHYFSKRPELDTFLDENGKAARLSIEQAERTKEARQAAADEALLTRNEAALRAHKPGQDLPPEIRQRYLQEPWRHGTPEMRQQALDLGYKPTAEDVRDFPHPTGDLRYNVRADYQTMIRPPAGATFDQTPFMRTMGGKHREEFAGFEKNRGGAGTKLDADQYALTENRLRLGRARVRQQATDRKTEGYLNAYGGWKPDTPVNVGELSHAPKRIVPGGDIKNEVVRNAIGSAVRGVRNVQRTAISLNPIPHALKNVGELAYIYGGPEALARGTTYIAKGVSKEQQARMAAMGLQADYIHDIEGPLKAISEKATIGGKHPIEALHQLSAQTMNRAEAGWRQALLDQLDRRWGPSSLDPESHYYNPALEYKKANEINRALGDYRNISLFTSYLQSIGGPFVAFRMGIVPAAVGRAILRRPGYVESIARTQQDINNQAMRGTGKQIQLGGPVSDAAELGFDPEQYLMSPSSIGPLGVAAQLGDPNRTKTIGTVSDALARMAIPQSSALIGSGALHSIVGGYGQTPADNAPGLKAAIYNALLSTFLTLEGGYVKRAPSRRAELKFERAERRAP